MLDVHPSHHAATTWRDFFIHIATIVVGLCIAVGLEQTVEFFHHRHQVEQTREALRLERDDNRSRLAEYTKAYRWESAALENNMLVLAALRHHPGTPQDKLPGILLWTMNRSLFAHAAWDTAQQSGILSLMPRDEVLADENLYRAFQDISSLNEEEWLALNDADRFLFRDPDLSHLTSAQIAGETELVEKLMMKHYLQGNFMVYPSELDPSFDPGPTLNELREFHNTETNVLRDDNARTPPRALTLDRLKAAGYNPST